MGEKANPIQIVRGGAMLDSIEFGRQIPDLSISRLPGGAWGLTTPTFGDLNHLVSAVMSGVTSAPVDRPWMPTETRSVYRLQISGSVLTCTLPTRATTARH